MKITKKLVLNHNYLTDAEKDETQTGHLVLCTGELEQFFPDPRRDPRGREFTLTVSDKPFIRSKSVEVEILNLENRKVDRARWFDPQFPADPYGSTLMHGAEDILIQIFGKVGRHTVYFRVARSQKKPNNS
jgi:hypothetical protein